MENSKKKDWHDIAAEASIEQDDEKLVRLANQLADAIDESIKKPPQSIDRSAKKGSAQRFTAG